MNKYYKIQTEHMNKINILMDNIEVAKGRSNIINFAQLIQLLQQVELITEQDKEGE